MTRNEMFDILKKNMTTVITGCCGRNVTEQSSLANDFGADSLQVVEIVSRTMRDTNVRVKRTELGRARNIGELLDLLCGSAR
ncbi:MAG TPA: phosphopantetheine-binding protein [Candidatus Binatia bacterium]|jgi:acyl carrier protein|nr:phosphopantetheine-binding protein [Candidatus Binatia bacterium]